MTTGKRSLALLLALLLLLAGCQAPPEEEEEPETWPSVLQEEEEAPPEEEAPVWPDTFSLAYHRGSTLDPVTCGEGLQQDVASLLYEPLFQLDGTFAPQPVLCADYQWDEAYLTCTLTIREGVLFHDGSTLTAGDVAATLRRAALSERYGYRLRQMASVTANNRRGEVVITLTAPNSGFLALLDIPIVKEGTDGQLVPLGTGPYLFVTGSDGAYLAVNGEWWQGKALPLERIELVHVKDFDTAANLFASHRLQLLSSSDAGTLPMALGPTGRAEVPAATLQFVGFNTVSGVFSQIAARRAFAQGVRREMVVDTFLSRHGMPAQFPIHPASALYPAELEQPYSYDQLLTALAEAGQQTGENKALTMLVSEGDSARISTAQFIAQELSLADWDIQVVVLPWSSFLEALAAGSFDLYYAEVRLTADWALQDLVGTGGALNYGRFTDTATDAYLSDLATASNRESAAKSLCARLQAMAPIAPVCFSSTTVLTHAGVVEGITPAPGNTFHHMEDWTVHLNQ